ncbi:Glutathione transporter 1 [Sparassis crispa]|uniref:Glutathione transporter 1 n=1 Tax=Sparassis crispa TaxID=139825 RepID=A0A401G897_9APHY|nr:Glutathione transporter 1 [Sparassis crispa]GBE78395.1 Glutathione transporter 1 [Sparassis crispa]
MPRRPPSSARPSTASHRPSTSRLPATPGLATPGYGPQYTDSQEYTIEEDEDESEAEDVFAFGPPSTADPASYFPSPPVAYPPPAFDFHDRAHAGPIPGPSTLYPRHPYPLSPPPVDSPPSTESQSQSHDGDAYRLQRLQPPPSLPASAPATNSATGTGTLSGVSSAISSRERKLPPTPASTSYTTSILDVDSREGSIKMEVDLEDYDEEDSPYPEVRASVSNIDDPDMPVMTIRMWFLGLLLTFIAGGANMFFYMRAPSPSLTPSLVVLVTHPLGKLCAYLLPITTYRLPRFLGRLEFSLNPGPWNIKEHALVYMMANVAIGAPYSILATIVSDQDYGRRLDYWFTVLLIISTQLTGFGLSGLCRRFLVWPASMIWPSNLITCTLLNTLHAEEDDGRGGVTRFRFLVYILIGAFFFFFLPGYLFTALSVFNWICWIAPNNIPVNQVFGISSGLGVSVITFDWTQISWNGSPLMVPWWAQTQIFGGFVLMYWIITPILYYTNTWDLAYFPLMSSNLYDRHGHLYNVTRVLDANNQFNETLYDNYSRLYLPATYAIAYLTAFALSSCAVVHTILYHAPTILRGIKRSRVEKDDIHAKLMRAYPEVPDWWYALVFLSCFSLALIANEVWHTGVPFWFLILAVLIPSLYIVPSGYVFAVTGQVITINLVVQVIPGVALPGQPVANMIFKAYALQTLAEGSRFVQDLKLGHYIKVPPRASFIVQLVGTLLTGFIQVGVQTWMFKSVPEICTPNQRDQLTCPYASVFFSASILWGLIGPSRQFGASSMYHPLLYAVAIGAVLPIPLWVWQRRYPRSWTRMVNTPMIVNAIANIPPSTGINYSSWFAVGFIFQYVIRKRNFLWWSKFNYVTSAALDSGTVICLLVLFFTLQLPKNGIALKWWGNSVWQRTADYREPPLYAVPPGGLS